MITVMTMDKNDINREADDHEGVDLDKGIAET
jgi:hypothetical protein